MTSDDRFTQLLQHIEELKRMIQDQATLGLGQDRQFIYVQKSKNSLWSFIATDEPVNANSTRWKSESEFKFKGILKLVFPFMKGMFKKQSMTYLKNFKTFAETGKSVN